jgi:hypothetical protein
LGQNWDNPADRTVVGTYFLREMEEEMVKIRKDLMTSQDRQKRCADKGRTHIEFGVGDHVFLKVKARRSSLKLGKYYKLAAHYCGPFKSLKGLVMSLI